jgi:hypothetical protein
MIALRIRTVAFKITRTWIKFGAHIPLLQFFEDVVFLGYADSLFMLYQYCTMYTVVCKFQNLAHLHVNSWNGQYSGAKCKEGNDEVSHDDQIVIFGA